MLRHSPAQIVRQLLVDLGAGSPPGAEGVAADRWPVYSGSEPDLPDNVITVFDTVGTNDGRSMLTGERFLHYGIQVRVRSADPTAGYTRASQVMEQLNEEVYRATVAVGDGTYLVQCISRMAAVIPLGKEVPETKRSLFTLNGLVSLAPI